MPGRQARAPPFRSGPCAKPPDMIPQNSPPTCSAARIAQDRQDPAALLHRPDARDAAAARHAPHRHRAGLRHRRLRDGDVDDAGRAPVTTLAWESFGEGWVTDVAKQLKLDPTVIRADYGQLPDLDAIDWSNDVLFTWNGTTSGVRVPNGDWIPADRAGPGLRRRDQRGLRL